MLASNGIPCLHSEVLLYSYLVTQCTENIFRTKVEPMKENVAEKEKLNWRLDQIIKGGAGIGVAYLLFGLGLSSYWITRCGSDFEYNTVYFFKDHEHRETVSFKERWKTHFYSNIRDYRYKLVYTLKKNRAKYYSGGPGKIMNVPVVHCSGVQQPFRQTDRYGVSSICVMEITPVLPGSS